MKTTFSDTEPDMLPEYDVDYSRSRPNRFVTNPAEHGLNAGTDAPSVPAPPPETPT